MLILMIILGILIIVGGISCTVFATLGWLAGASFCILVYGIVRIVASLILKKINQALPDETRSAEWLVAMATGVLITLTGIVCIVQPMVSAIAIGWYVLSSGAETLLIAVHGLRRR